MPHLVTIFAVFFACLPNLVLAQDERQAPTLSFNLGGALTTYKSKIVKSNDTSFTVGFQLGTWGGEDHTFGTGLSYETNTTNFEYGENETSSSIASTFQDIAFRYRLGFFYLGVVLSQSQFLVNRYDVEYLDMLGTGAGGNGGLVLVVGRRGRIFLDLTFVSTLNVKESLQSDDAAPAIGSRTDIFFGGTVGITRSALDFVVGLKQRTYSLEVAGESFAEVQTMTWLGLATQWLF
ncbi:MAG: hypothetical protein HYW48_01935 [Deltaproteobacteria bacterium]|nr:hypothetical protein [Deltaproteobacteria bacterium]